MGTIECCRRNGNTLEVPCITGQLTILREVNDLLIVRKAGQKRRSRTGPKYVKGSILLVRLRQAREGDRVQSSSSLSKYDNQVMEVIEELSLSKGSVELLRARLENHT